MAGGALLPPPHSTSANTHLPEIRVVVLGDGTVGKTSLLRQYLDHEGPSSSCGCEPTLLDSYTHIEYCDKQPYRVHFTDCSSAPEFCEHRAAYLAKCDVVLLVFSVQHRRTLTNLPGWMKEVVDARTSAGPARFASTTGDFSEVPVFVIGTHYGERDAPATQRVVSCDEAESVTKDCLHAAGYFLNEDDAEAEEEQRSMRLAAKKPRKPSKKKQSPNAFRGFFADLFRGSASDDDEDENAHRHHGKSTKSKADDKAAKKGKKGDAVQQHFSPHSRTTSLTRPPCAADAERPHIITEPFGGCAALSEEGTPLALPSGASPRLPLYLLSNDDGVAVRTAVRASLALHLWLKQLDYSDEVSPGVTPLPSPRAKSSLLLAPEKPSTVGGQVRSTPPVELAGMGPQHGRSVSAASHNSHVSERSAASFIPSMHALYGSVTSLSAFDTSFHNSRAASSAPTTNHNSPLGPGQAAQILMAVEDSSLMNVSSTRLDRQTSNEPFGSATNASRSRGPLDNSPCCSPTVLTPCKLNVLPKIVVATPIMKGMSSERSPDELDATVTDKALHPPYDQLVPASTDIFVSSPPNPRRATAPNTVTKTGNAEQEADLSVSTPYGEYSALSGQITGDRCVRPLPAWATADTPEPHHDIINTNVDVKGHHRLWKDVDAEPRDADSPRAASEQGGAGGAPDSVVKKLALEHVGKSAATSPAKSPGTPLAGRSPLPSNSAPQPSASHFSSVTSSASTLSSPIISPQSRGQTLTHSGSPSHVSTPQPQPQPHERSRSHTRAPHPEDEGLAKSTSLSASGSHSRAHTKDGAQQKQKANQCTSDGCRMM